MDSFEVLKPLSTVIRPDGCIAYRLKSSEEKNII